MKYKHTVISRFIWEKWLLQPTSVEAICAKIEVNLVDNLNSVAFKNERYLVASSLEWWMDVSSLKWMVEHIQCTSSWNDANTKHIVLTRKPNFEKKYTNDFNYCIKILLIIIFKRSWRARALLNIGKILYFVDPHLFLFFEFSSLEVLKGPLSFS